MPPLSTCHHLKPMKTEDDRWKGLLHGETLSKLQVTRCSSMASMSNSLHNLRLLLIQYNNNSHSFTQSVWNKNINFKCRIESEEKQNAQN